MRRVLIPLVASFAVSPVFAATATAERLDVDNYGTGAIEITGNKNASRATPGPAAPSPQWFTFRRVDYVPGTGLCWTTSSTTDAAEAAAHDVAYSPALSQLPNCPIAPSTPPSPGELARAFWDVRHLPAPTLEVVPDYAVSGKRVYLTIKGPPTAAFQVPNPIGDDVGITATSRYTVDWGDGTPPTTTTSQGGPWPEGDLTHVYDSAGGSVTITVTQAWSATWSAGPTGGALDNLQTVGSLTLRVEQVQAVRNR